MPAISPGDVLKFTPGTGSEAHFKQLPQDFQNALVAAGQEYQRTYGEKLIINSAFRSRAEQQRLIDQKKAGKSPNPGGVVASVDTSPHVRGFGVDIGQGGKAANILKKYGIDWQNIKDDRTHYNFHGNSVGATSRKTASASTSTQASGNPIPEKFALASENNILNQYNSWNYNFTIGCLPQTVVNSPVDPDLVKQSIEKYTVLTSKGKGTRGIDDELNKELVDAFNKSSPGSFDLFIDDVEIKSLITSGSEEAGSTQVHGINFVVQEPYSMNGFIEALQVASVAAGYENYMNANFALKVEFTGYRDDIPVNELTSEIVPKSTRYFVIQIATIEVTVSEAGTKYRCSAVPNSDLALGNASMLLTDLTVGGATVGEVLCNFFKEINTSVKNNAKKSKDETDPKHDIYEISCPKFATEYEPSDVMNAMLYSPRQGVMSSNGESNSYQNDIIKEKMNQGLSDFNIFNFSDPALTKGYVGAKPEGGVAKTADGTQQTTQPDSKTGGKTQQFKFSSNHSISDCITAIILHSEYIRVNVLHTQIQKAKDSGDPYITYFRIGVEVDTGEFDIKNNRYYRVYRYVLNPFRKLYIEVPGYGQSKIDMSPVLYQIKREYNYMYSGKNTDIIKFELKFDKLYFEALPKMLGNTAASSTPGTASRNNTVEAKQPNSAISTKSDSDSKTNSTIPSPEIQPQRSLTSQAPLETGQRPYDPYQKLALEMHKAILQSVSMISGNMEILGDPYFLVNGGSVTESLKLDNSKTGTTMITEDGQAAVTQGDLFIQINYRNPIDISTTGENAGLIEFGPLLPFSGLYKVNGLTSNFKGGVFTQELNILRIPQPDPGTPEIVPNLIKNSPLPGEQKTEDTKPSDVQATGIRQDSMGLLSALSRGLPDVSGNFINFVTDGEAALSNAIGSVGNLSKSLTSDFSGIAGQAGELANQLNGGIDNLGKKITASAELFNSTIVSPDLSAASIAAASKSISKTIGIDANEAATAMATTVATQITEAGGSANDIVSGVNKSISNLVGKVDNVVGDVTNEISKAFNSSLSDPLAIANSLRIDTSKVSGLLGPMGSQITGELTKLSSLIPDNVNFGALENKGLMFKFITGDKIPNLPPAQPSVSAPKPLPDPALTNIINSFGNISGTLDNLTNLPALTDVNKITNSLGSLSSGLDNISGAVQGLSDNIGTVNSIFNNVVGDAVGVVNSVGSRAQNAVSGVMPASVGLGSVESGSLAIKSILQTGSTPVNSSLDTTVISALGSKQTQSPLVKLIQDNNIQGII